MLRAEDGPISGKEKEENGFSSENSQCGYQTRLELERACPYLKQADFDGLASKMVRYGK